jgi:hypothetical protein
MIPLRIAQGNRKSIILNMMTNANMHRIPPSIQGIVTGKKYIILRNNNVGIMSRGSNDVGVVENPEDRLTDLLLLLFGFIALFVFIVLVEILVQPPPNF